MTLEEMLKNDRDKIDIVALSINRKELEYNKYIITHKENVKYAFIKYGHLLIQAFIDPLDFESFDNIFDEIQERVDSHDNSKYSFQEFNGYRSRFFPIKEEEGLNFTNFESAWKHHYTNNDHHPEFWYRYNDDGSFSHAESMPNEAIIEMTLDWVAMSMNPSDKAYTYYRKNKDEYHFHPDTRAKFEKLLDIVEKYDKELGDV